MGLSGPIQLDANGDVTASVYEILNLVGKSPRVVGFWNKSEGFSPSYNSKPGNGSTPSDSEISTQNPSQLQDVIWPGGSAQVPKGWVVAKNGERLSIAVPLKSGFKEVLDVQKLGNVTTFHGFSIDVFEAAVGYLLYPLNYTYVAYGDGIVNPNYDELVRTIVHKTFDAVVGDITITTERSKIVDFTQPFTDAGLVVLVPTRTAGSSNAWAFLRPFTPLMWMTTVAFFLFTGISIWILEHKKNEEFRGIPKRQIGTTFWFIFSTLFFSHRKHNYEVVILHLRRHWAPVRAAAEIMIADHDKSNLTAHINLTMWQGITGLVTSKLKIGIQAGTYVGDYLLQLGVPQDRIIPLQDETAYASNLYKGTVGALVDGLPYIQLFLSKECRFTIAGQAFTKGGLGFAFPKGSQLAVDMSTAILQLSQDGSLQRIHDYWLSNRNCDESDGSVVDSNQLGVGTFWGLFLITGVASVFCIVFYCSRLCWQHRKFYVHEDSDSGPSVSRSSRHKSFLRSLASFMDEPEVHGNEEPVTNDPSRKHSKKARRPVDIVGEESSDQNAGVTLEH